MKWDLVSLVTNKNKRFYFKLVEPFFYCPIGLKGYYKLQSFLKPIIKKWLLIIIKFFHYF